MHFDRLGKISKDLILGNILKRFCLTYQYIALMFPTIISLLSLIETPFILFIEIKNSIGFNLPRYEIQ